jgi:hypothetical protein
MWKNGIFPRPWLDINISHLQVDTPRQMAEFQYFLHFSHVQIIASQHPTSVLGSSPHTSRGAQPTVTETEGHNFRRSVGVQVSDHPNLGIGASSAGIHGIEKVRNTGNVVFSLSTEGAPDDRVMQWDYEIDDEREQRFGHEFEHPPRVQLGLDVSPPNIPHLEVEMLMYWCLPTDNAKNPCTRISRIFSLKAKKRPCAPVYVNVLQQLSISIPLENLKGICSALDPSLKAKTQRQPVPDGGLQCKATKMQPVDSYSNSVHCEPQTWGK